MEHLKHQRDWMTIPTLSCISIEETLSFWEMLGFTITYKMTRPYQYGVVERNGYALHFAPRVKGIDTDFYYGCLVMVYDAKKVYEDFKRRFKEYMGKVPHSGLPRISKMKPGATRFTLTDISGNCVFFINYGNEDQETWEKVNDKNQTPLQKSIAAAIRFRDYKEDEKASVKTLDVALKKVENEAQVDIAEALLMRIDLATILNEPIREKECRTLLTQVNLSDKEKEQLAQKHNVKL